MIGIATYTDPTDAYNAQALLKRNGIHCTLQNSAHTAAGTLQENITLSVDAHAAAAARDVLANALPQTE